MPQITDRNLRLGFLYRIETPTPVRFWTGARPLHVAADAVETEGGIYLGIDFTQALPNFNLLANGTADTLTLTLSGVDNHFVDLIDLDADEVEGRDLHIGLIQFTADWQIANVPLWRKNFTVEKIGWSVVPVNDPDSDITHTSAVSISLAYGASRRRRSLGGYWTPDRAAIGDLGLSHVPDLDTGVTIIWPPLGG